MKQNVKIIFFFIKRKYIYNLFVQQYCKFDDIKLVKFKYLIREALAVPPDKKTQVI